MTTYSVWQYLHIMLFVYWLGADLGVFLASRYVARADLPTAERLRFLELLLKIDMGPRTALIMIIPVGVELATALGLIDLGNGAVLFIWLLSLAWLGLSWYLFVNARNPAAQSLMRLDQGIRVLVALLFVALGVLSWLQGAPLGSRWLAAKFVLFAGVVVLGLVLRTIIRDWVVGFGLLRDPASTDKANALIFSAYRRATRFAHTLWLLVALIAFLGVTKPLLGG